MPTTSDETAVRVYLGHLYEDVTWDTLGDRAIVIVPEHTAWNDFSSNFRARLYFVGFGESRSAISIRMMIEGFSYLTVATSQFAAQNAPIPIENLVLPFVSILSETSDYREIVARLGFTDAIVALRMLHDVVLGDLDDDAETIRLSRTLAFSQGALREDGTWAALRHGGRYLTPSEPPDVHDAASSFRFNVQLEGMPGVHEVDADFGEDFPLSRRAMVLVGENGVGKTRLFNSLIRALQVPEDGQEDPLEEPFNFVSRPSISRLLVFSSVATDQYPLSVPPWRGLDYRLHRMVGRPADVADDLAQSLIDCTRSAAEVEGLLGRSGMDLLDSVLDPLGVKNTLYVAVTDEIDEANILPDPLKIGGRSYLPFFSTRGEQRRLQLQARIDAAVPPIILSAAATVRPLSSGEEALLRFATQAIGSVRTGSLLLFDEPETHLHPRYISQFMSMLDRLLEASKSVAMIATHSAFVVREVPARRVRIIRKEIANGITVEQPAMQTFGANIDTISQFVFGDVEFKHRFQEVLDSWLASAADASLQSFRDRFRQDVNAETLSYFAQILSDRDAE